MAKIAEAKKALSSIGFFSGLDTTILDKVAEAALLRHYKAGEAIIRQGEVGPGLYAILRGRVKVEREHEGVSQQLAVLGPQQSFAESSLVDNQPRSAAVTAIEETECLLLTRDSFLQVARSHPTLALRLAQVLAERLRSADEKLAAVAPPPVDAPPAFMRDTKPRDASATSEGLTKGRVQASMLDTFSQLYAMKALVRFSVAVIGCPVEGSASNARGQIRVGETKALLLPADEAVSLDIDASQNGTFTLHVFAPDVESPVRFGPLPVSPADHFQLRIADGATSLWNANRRIP